MRVGFGLLALLVVVAIMLVVASQVHVPIAQKGRQAQEKASDIAGHEFYNSVKFDAGGNGNRQWVEVTWVDPAGPAATYYGLMVKDRVIQFGDRTVDALGADVAKEMIVDAYRSPEDKWPLVVVRNGQSIVLPGGAPASPGMSLTPGGPAINGGGPPPGPATPPTGQPDPLAPLRGKLQLPQ